MRRTPREMTVRQQEIATWISDFIDAHNYPPSVREIGEAFGIKSPNGVVCHLRYLEQKGVIKRDRNTARSIVMTPEAEPDGETEFDRMSDEIVRLRAENAELRAELNKGTNNARG